MLVTNRSKYLWIAGIAVFLLFYFIFDPTKYDWMPQCLFHKFTGLQCIGCGSQRVIYSLLHGDVSGAIHSNALLVFSIPFLTFLLWLEIFRTKHPVLYCKVHSLPLIITVSAILIVWLILRNILHI